MTAPVGQLHLPHQLNVLQEYSCHKRLQHAE